MRGDLIYGLEGHSDRTERRAGRKAIGRVQAGDDGDLKQ